ncbi:hypothetical protein [uncultured Sunxiuqinia sp.]|uniref:hypothetical protein n=1 Tax=uncultured Sunxiuqinia sp. TaxID=1573825 RepID=UPI00260B5FC4|nr:hypothetical protein [uncultured Sunxiuqinia sp.]
MKKSFAFVLLVIALFGCKTLDINMIPRTEQFSGIDFRPYTQKGFLITPEKYQGEYESIGIVSYLIFPESTREGIKEEGTMPYQHATIRFKWNTEEINVQNALEGMYKECLNMGADALVNFDVALEEELISSVSPPVMRKGYRVTGFAIRRK